GALQQQGQVRTAGTVDATAASITMTASALTDASGNLRYATAGDLQLGRLASDGSISLLAATITVAGLDAGQQHLTAAQVRLDASGGVGTGIAPVLTQIGGLSGNAASLYLNNSGELTIASTGSVVTQRVTQDGSTEVITDAALDNLVTPGTLVIVNQGTLTTRANGALTAGGNLLLQALGNEADMFLQGDITSQTGHISLHAGRDLRLQSLIETLAQGHTVELDVARSLMMEGDGQIRTQNGAVRLNAASGATPTAVNQMVVGQIDAGTAGVSLRAGQILALGDTLTHVRAGELRLLAVQGVGNDGSLVNPLRVEVDVLAARGRAQGVFVHGEGHLTVGRVETIAVNRVEQTGSLAAGLVMDGAMEDVETILNGAVVIRADQLTISQGSDTPRGVNAVGTGNVLLEARNGDLSLQARVLGDIGHVALVASGNIRHAGLGTGNNQSVVDVRGTSITAHAGGQIVMADMANVTTGGGNLYYSAGDDLLVARITAGLGTVVLESRQGGIADNQLTPTASATNILAGGLALIAEYDLGTLSNGLELSVSQLSAVTTQGAINLFEASGLTVDQVEAAFGRVGLDGALVNVELKGASGLLSEGDGDIRLRVQNSLALADGVAVRTEGEGDIYLTTVSATQGNMLLGRGELGTATGNLVLSSARAIESDAVTLAVAGDAMIQADDAARLNGNTTVSGTLDLTSVGDTELAGSLVVAGTSDMTVGGALFVTGSYTGGDNVTWAVTGATDVDGVLDVTGDLTLSGADAIKLVGLLTVSGDVSLDGSDRIVINVTGDIGGALQVMSIGDLMVEGDLRVGAVTLLDAQQNTTFEGALVTATLVAQAGNDLTIRNQSATLSAERLQAGGVIDVQTTGSLTLLAGMHQAHSSALLDVGDVLHTHAGSELLSLSGNVELNVGRLEMAAGSVVGAELGNVAITGQDDLNLAEIQATEGAVQLSSRAGLLFNSVGNTRINVVTLDLSVRAQGHKISDPTNDLSLALAQLADQVIRVDVARLVDVNQMTRLVNVIDDEGNGNLLEVAGRNSWQHLIDVDNRADKSRVVNVDLPLPVYELMRSPLVRGDLVSEQEARIARAEMRTLSSEAPVAESGLTTLEQQLRMEMLGRVGFNMGGGQASRFEMLDVTRWGKDGRVTQPDFNLSNLARMSHVLGRVPGLQPDVMGTVPLNPYLYDLFVEDYTLTL
ncbi:MAG: hypothetical protein LAT63_17160, partial [Marinobacter sp.]|nr:hypothetical protein [Marinobacter sp.]